MNPSKTWKKPEYTEEEKLINFKELYPNLNIELLFQNIRAESYGIGSTSFLEVAKGISLHTEIKDLKEVKALRRETVKKKGCWQKI